MLKHALLASLLLLPLATSEALAVNAGVTAAVNQSAKSTPPGGGVRTVVLGANVVQDEKIETDGAGLVQILLADGTTFTVGPNSSLVIDRFVYDPDANTAQVAATLGRGVFRFIGGRTSKSEGGVQLNTPVGTVGIRGGMADLNFTGTGGTIAQIDLLFGNEVTLNGPNGGDRIFQAGYSIIIGPNGQPTVVKTPPGSANIIQQALAGRPGSTGGSPNSPDDEDVANSGVPGNNSNNNPPPTDIPPPDLTAIDLATPKPNDNHQTAGNTIPQAPTTLNGTYNGYASAWVERSGEGAESAFYRNILPSDVALTFSKTARSLSGSIKVSEEGNSPYPGYVQVAFGPENGGDSIYYNDLFYYSTGTAQSVDTDMPLGSVSSGGTYVLSVGLSGTDPNCDCDFIQLGAWLTAVDGNQANIGAIGTFVVGDLITSTEYNSIDGDATYDGVALGFVSREGATNAASGDLHLTYNFQNRDGTIEIRNFGTDEFLFSDYLSGSGTTFSSDSELCYECSVHSFSASGTFVNDGSAAAAGVIGNFSASGSDWEAGGVFAGTQTSFEPAVYN